MRSRGANKKASRIFLRVFLRKTRDFRFYYFHEITPPPPAVSNMHCRNTYKKQHT